MGILLIPLLKCVIVRGPAKLLVINSIDKKSSEYYIVNENFQNFYTITQNK